MILTPGFTCDIDAVTRLAQPEIHPRTSEAEKPSALAELQEANVLLKAQLTMVIMAIAKITIVFIALEVDENSNNNNSNTTGTGSALVVEIIVLLKAQLVEANAKLEEPSAQATCAPHQAHISFPSFDLF